MLKKIGKYILELLVVAFGVLLGLYVSNLNEKKHIQSNVDRTLEHIIAELESNVEKLERAYNYHDTLCVNFKNYQQSIEDLDFLEPHYRSEFRHFKIPGWKGTHMAGLEDIAFESAKINGVFQELDIELTQQISRAYRIKDSYMTVAQAPLNKFIGLTTDSKVLDVIGILELMCNDITHQEKWAKAGIEKIIKEIKEN